MATDLDRLGAAWRLQLDYDHVELGTSSWDAPTPLRLCVGSFLLYIIVFILSHYTPLPSASALERLKKVSLSRP